MKIAIKSPTIARVVEASSDELDVCRKALSYQDQSVRFLLTKHQGNRWFRQKAPTEWEHRLRELQSQLRGSALYRDKDGHWMRPGSLSYLPDSLSVEIVSDDRRRPKFNPVGWFNEPPFEPYGYQKEALQKLLAEGHGAVQLATGLGKSHIISMLAKEVGRGTVVTTPSVAIFNEMLSMFQNLLGKSRVGAYGDGKKQIGKDFTVCVMKSLSLIEPGTNEWKFFSKANAVISDEAHCNPSDSLEKAFHGLFADVPYRFFLSGTQTRGDGSLPILKSINGPMLMDMSTEDGVKGGYLSPLRFFVVPVRSTNPSYNVKDANDMKRVHLLYNDNVIDIATRIANEAAAKDEGTLILVEEIEQLARVAKKLNVPFAYAHGNTTKKDKLEKLGLTKVKVMDEIEKFNKGEVRVFIGTSCVSTGTNFYPTHNTINLQGGASEIKTKQGTIGRSARLLSKSKYKDFSPPKPYTKVWDFHIIGIDKMAAHLKKRVGFYRDTGCPIEKVTI